MGVKIAVQQHVYHKPALASASRPDSSKNGNEHNDLPNVILIVADSLRAQSMSVYGYGGQTTPSLERFARRSSVYLQTHSNATTTVPSMLSLLTGKHPFNHGRLTRALPIRLESENLLNVLGSYGYKTGAITSNVYAAYPIVGLDARLSQPESTVFAHLTLSWLRNLGVSPTRFGGRMYADLAAIVPFIGYPNRTSIDGQVSETLDEARQAVEELRQPFFLSVHIHEPHEPYAAPPDTHTIGAEGKLSGIEAKEPVRFYARYEPVQQPLVDLYKSQYEESVRMVDGELGALFRFLESRSWFGNSLVIVTGDHGESFEHGYLGHGEELYENSTHVPLIIRFPRQMRGERVSGPTQSVDIAPTILRTIGIPPPAWVDGEALMPGRPPASVATVAVNYRYPENDVTFPMPTKLALWWGHYKIISSCDSDHTELYDLSRDPDELVNLAPIRSDLLTDLKRRLHVQLAKQSHEPKLTCPSMNASPVSISMSAQPASPRQRFALQW